MDSQDEVVILRARVIELEAKLEKANNSITKLLEMAERATELAKEASRLAESKLKGPVRDLQRKLNAMAHQVDALNAEKDVTVKRLEAAMSLLSNMDLPFGKPLAEIIGEFSKAIGSGEIKLRNMKNSILAYMEPDMRAAFEAAQAHSEAIARSSLAQDRALKKLANDPKQAAKTEAFKLWQQWQQGKALHKSGAAFARHVIATLPAIESSKVVERWVTDWQRNAGKK